MAAKESVRHCIPVMRQLVRLATLAVLLTALASAQFDREFDAPCERVWANALTEMDEFGFDASNIDKDSLFGRFSYRVGYLAWGGGAGDAARTFTHQNSSFVDQMSQFRIQHATLQMKDHDGGCTVTLRIAYQGIKTSLFGGSRLLQLSSNSVLEGRILKDVEPGKVPPINGYPEGVHNPNDPPLPAAPVKLASPLLTFTSDPPGADIEIDGAFIGNTPSTKTIKQNGPVTAVIIKSGYKVWLRDLNLADGDVLTLHADLEPRDEP